MPEDAGTVADLLATCVRVDGGEESTGAGHLLDDWPGAGLAQEAVLAPDGTVAGYADGVNRPFASVTVYGYVRPEYRGRGPGLALLRRAFGEYMGAASARSPSAWTPRVLRGRRGSAGGPGWP